MDKALLQQIRIDMDAALAAVKAKHGLKMLEAGNCSFSKEGCFTFKVEGVAKDGLTKEAIVYAQLVAIEQGLPPLNKVLTYRTDGTVVSSKVVGCNTTGSKIFLERNGKTVTMPVEAVKKIFALPQNHG